MDIGETFIKNVVMNKQAEKLAGGKYPTSQNGLESFLTSIEQITEDFKASFALCGLAVSSLGAVNVKTGFIGGSSVIPYIHGVCMTELLNERTGLLVSLENDANCSALAEGWIDPVGGMSI